MQKTTAKIKTEDWMNSKWRPMMGWMYMLVCISDFVIFPVLWSIVQVIAGGEVKSQWNPITLQGAGLFHMAMGAVLGLTAWGRTQEKMTGANNGGLALSNPTAGASIHSFGSVSSGSTTMNPVSNLDTTTVAASRPMPSFGGSTPVASATGKPMPVQPTQPEL